MSVYYLIQIKWLCDEPGIYCSRNVSGDHKGSGMEESPGALREHLLIEICSQPSGAGAEGKFLGSGREFIPECLPVL